MKHFETLNIPLNIEHGIKKTPYMTKARVLVGIVLTLVFFLASISNIYTCFILSETRDIIAGILRQGIITLVYSLILRFGVLNEKYLKRVYANLLNNVDVPLASTLEGFNYEIIDNVPVFHLKNGYYLIGIRLDNDAIVGYDTKLEIERHEMMVADIIKEINLRFKKCYHLNLMETIGTDRRWEDLLTSLNKCDLDIIKILASSIAEYNMLYKVYESHDYFFIYDNPTLRPVSKIIHDAKYIAQEFIKAKYKSYEFVTVGDIQKIYHSLTGITGNFEQELDHDKDLEDAATMIRAIEVFKNGERKVVGVPFNEDTVLNTSKKRRRHGK